MVPTVVPLKEKPVKVPLPCAVTVEEPIPPPTLLPLVPVKTRLNAPFIALLVTTTEKFVLPPVITALVPPKLVVTIAMLASACT